MLDMGQARVTPASQLLRMTLVFLVQTSRIWTHRCWSLPSSIDLLNGLGAPLHSLLKSIFNSRACKRMYTVTVTLQNTLDNHFLAFMNTTVRFCSYVLCMNPVTNPPTAHHRAGSHCRARLRCCRRELHSKKEGYTAPRAVVCNLGNSS